MNMINDAEIIVDVFGQKLFSQLSLKHAFPNINLCDLSKVGEYSPSVRLGLGKFYGADANKIMSVSGLAFLQLIVSGFDHLDVAKMKRTGTVISNADGINSQSVAEHTINLMLSLARQTIRHHAAVLDGSFANQKETNVELAEKNIFIIGVGNIGLKVAKLADAFGMVVYAFDPYKDLSSVAEISHQFENLDDGLKIADFVSVHAPLTSTTKGMLNRSFISAMKPSSFLINCARGGIQIDEDLLDAALVGRIAGIGLDVFNQENSKCVFSQLSKSLTLKSRVALAPHTGPSAESRERLVKYINENLVRVLTGEKPLGVVREYL